MKLVRWSIYLILIDAASPSAPLYVGVAKGTLFKSLSAHTPLDRRTQYALAGSTRQKQ